MKNRLMTNTVKKRVNNNKAVPKNKKVMKAERMLNMKVTLEVLNILPQKQLKKFQKINHVLIVQY